MYVCVCVFAGSPLASTAPQGSGLAPPFNPQAETPHEVYNISDSILAHYCLSLFHMAIV